MIMLRAIFFLLMLALSADAQTLLPFSSGASPSSPIIPASRITTWQPGLTFNAIPASGAAGNTIPSNYTGAGYGIPTNRTQCGTTLSPLGGGADDKPQIQAAVNACTANHYVLLNCGHFILKTPINYQSSPGYITLRGCGPGKGLSTGVSPVSGPPTLVADATATILDYGQSTAGFGPVIGVGPDGTNPGEMEPLSVDMVAGSYIATLTTAVSSNVQVGTIVRIDQNTDNDPDVYWGNHCPAGAQVLGGISGTTLTVSSIISGTVITNATVGGSHVVYVDVVGIARGGTEVTTQLSGTTGGVGTYQLNNSQTLASSSYLTVGCETRQYFNRQDRSILQMFEVASITNAGKTLTFTTPARHTYCAGSGSCSTTPAVTAGEAQLTTMGSGSTPSLYGFGIEELMVAIGTQGGNGNISVDNCMYCWVKHVESYWSNGVSINLSNCFRCEIRDSYAHETPDPVSGGAGYLLAFSWGTSDSLMENNVSWYGDKNVVGQSTGGGNVFGYNYTADAFEYTFPSLPESGLNEAHNTTSKMGLIEGNESHEYSGDTFWGGIIDMTVFRNNFTGLRPGGAVSGTQAGIPPLNTWMSGGCPYVDDGLRSAVQIQTAAYRTNFVGNVVGFSGQPLINQTCSTQSSFAFEDLTMQGTGLVVYDYYIGEVQCCNGSLGWDSTTYVTQLRQGNWSWQTGTQIWYSGTGIGATGSTSTGSPITMPNSYYYVQGESQPPWYASSSYCPCTWPWVNPSNGTVSTYPAKARFLNGQSGGSYNQL